MDGVIRKYNAAFSSLFQYTCPKQDMNIAVNRADVAFRPTGYLANSHRSMASHQLKKRPAFGRQCLPKEIFRSE